MATNESTAKDQPNEAAKQATEYAFEACDYGWPEVEHANLPGGAVQRFADKVEAVSIGAASILRLIEWDGLRGDDHENEPETMPAPVLSDYYRGALLRMVAVNMDLLSEQAESLKRWAYLQHTAKGKAERLREAEQLVRMNERRNRA